MSYENAIASNGKVIKRLMRFIELFMYKLRKRTKEVINDFSLNINYVKTCTSKRVLFMNVYALFLFEHMSHILS